jgi:hypothetical protein
MEEVMDQFMVLFKIKKNGTVYAADYDWIRRGEWTQLPRDSNRSTPDDLDEDGRRAILIHFGLWASSYAPSLADITTMPSRKLIELCRRVEEEQRLPPIDPFNYLIVQNAEPIELSFEKLRLVAA